MIFAVIALIASLVFPYALIHAVTGIKIYGQP